MMADNMSTWARQEVTVDYTPLSSIDLNGSASVMDVNGSFNASYNDSMYGDYSNGGMTSDIYFYIILWTYVAPAMFGLISIIGVVGNALVIYIILAKKTMRSVTNILLLNLAFSDIAFLIITVPFTAYKYAAFSWDFGDVFCKIVQYFLYVSAYVTVWTLVAISAYRYLCVVHSEVSQRYRTKTNVIMLCVGIWLLVLSIQIPVLLSHITKHVGTYSYCGIKQHAVGAVFVTFFVFAYVLPLFIICLLYLLIGIHLHKKKASSHIDNKASNKRMARATRILVLVVIVFCISWLPLHINSLVAKYGQLPMGAWYEVFRILWNCMAYGNSCINPVIYNYASLEFRKAFRDILCCQKCKSSSSIKDAQSQTELTKMVKPCSNGHKH